MRTARLALAITLGVAAPAAADPPVILDVVATPEGDGRWRFSVTIAHPDTGWEHHADGWEVVAPDGTQLGFRELFHPHVEEQPFTRSLGGVRIPSDISEVTVRARDNVDGWGGDPVTVLLPR